MIHAVGSLSSGLYSLLYYCDQITIIAMITNDNACHSVKQE